MNNIDNERIKNLKVFKISNKYDMAYYLIKHADGYNLVYDKVNKEAYQFNKEYGHKIPFLEDIEAGLEDAMNEKQSLEADLGIFQSEDITEINGLISIIKNLEDITQKDLKETTDTGELIEYNKLRLDSVYSDLHSCIRYDEHGEPIAFNRLKFILALDECMEYWGISLTKEKLSKDLNKPNSLFYMPFKNIYVFKDDNDLLNLVNEVYALKQGLVKKRDISTALNGVTNTITKNYDFISFKNGLLNVKTREFITKAKEPILPYLQHNTEYKNDTPTNIEDLKTKYGDTEFMQYVTSSLTEEDQMAFIEYLGYCMIAGNTETIIMYLVGVGGTGKSVALNLINTITSEQTNSLNLSKFCSNDGTDENVEVYNALVAIDPDSSNDIIQTTKKLKQVSGGDRIRVRALYCNPFTAEPEEVAKIVCAGNVLPKFSRLESADYDRFYFIEFNNKFRGTAQEKKNLKELLAKEKELIINICLNAYLKNGLSIKEKQSLTIKKDLYEKYSNPLINAINNLVTISEIRDPDEYVPVREFEDVILKYAETYKTPLDLNKENRLKPGVLLRGIRKAFDLSDTYKSEGKTKCYKYLQPTDKYNEMLKLLNKE